MKIISCAATDPVALEVYRLRYQIFAEEMSFEFDKQSIEGGLLLDQLDSRARILVALEDDLVISSIRMVHYADLDDQVSLSPVLHELLQLNRFLPVYRNHICIASRLFVRPNMRGSLAMMRLLSEGYSIALKSGIKYIFGYSQPHLLDIYTKIGWQIYASPVATPRASLTPLVCITHDFAYLARLRSPLFRAAIDSGFVGEPDESVSWFQAAFGRDLAARPSTYDQSQIASLIDYFFTSELDPEDIPSILNGFTKSHCGLVLGFCKVIKYFAGERLVSQGHKSREMFIILSGQVAVTMPGTLRSVRIGPGQVVGEISLLMNTACTADCIVELDSHIAILSQQAMRRLLSARPDLGVQLMLNITSFLSYRSYFAHYSHS